MARIIQNKFPIDLQPSKAIGFGFPIDGPAVFIPTFTTREQTKANLVNYSFYTAISLCIVHTIGIIYLIFGKIFGNWIDNLLDLIFINTFIPFPTQLLLCISISLLSILLKRLLIVKWIYLRVKAWKQ